MLNFNLVSLNETENTIIARINGVSYVYVPDTKSASDIWRSTNGVLRYSAGRALQYLKNNAIGFKLTEA